jgi:hypothetical protein
MKKILSKPKKDLIKNTEQKFWLNLALNQQLFLHEKNRT